MSRVEETPRRKRWSKGIFDKIWLLAIVFLFCSLIYAIFSSSMVFAQPPASRGGLRGPGRTDAQHRFVPGEILVKFKPGTPAARISAVNAHIGARAIKKFPITKVHHLRLPPNVEVIDAVKAYSLYPEVVYAEPNYMVHILDFFPNDPRFPEQWALHNTGQTGGTADADIDAPEAWQISTGSADIVVAVIDTGVDYNHEDLASNMWTNPGEIPGDGLDNDGNGYIDDIYGWDFYNNDNDPWDDHSHGTHCAGIMGAVGNNGIGIAGVNHTVKIMALKFLSAGGSGPTSAAISCVEYAIAEGAYLTSNSWGGGGYSQTLRDAISASDAAGMLFIAAAGNDGYDTDLTPHYPSSYDLPNIISVAATDHNDALTWSNWGTRSVDLAAPGAGSGTTGILSTVPGNQYDWKQGTSMACPYISGAAALTWAVYPGLSNSQVKLRILATGDPIPALVAKVLSERRLNINTCLRATATSVNVNIAFPRNNFSVLKGDTVPVVAFVTDNAGGVLSSSTLTATFSNGDPSITLYDDGAHNDEIAGDGIYAGTWEPSNLGPTDITIVATESGLTQGQDTNSGNVTQPYNYSYDGTVPFEWTDATTGTALGIGDEDYAEISIGFDFEFYGNTYSSVKVTDNGYLTFGPSATWYPGNVCIPDPAEPNDLIAPLWDDLDPSDYWFLGAEVYYLLEGTAPNRRLTIEWYHVPHWIFWSDDGVTFEVTLYETTNEMKFQYLDVDFDNSFYDNGASATVGIENATGTQGLQYSCNEPALSDGLAIRIYRVAGWETCVESYPNERAPGGSAYPYLFKYYEFDLEKAGDLYIQFSGRANSGEQNGTGNDDDLGVMLDGTFYGWNNKNSLNGNAQEGSIRTVEIKAEGISGGHHILSLWADARPKLDTIKVISAEAPDEVVETYPNETAPGGNIYLFKTYEFNLEEASDLYICLVGKAQNGPQNGTDDDDDLSVQLDGTWYGWNNLNSLDGGAQNGSVRTVRIKAESVAAGSHTLILWADETPILYSLEVTASVPDNYLQVYPNETAPGGNCYLWRQYDFTLDETSDLYIQLTGLALNASQNGTGDDDDLSIQLDDTFYGWNNENSLDGNAQAGSIRTARIYVPDVAAGSHTLILWADETPTLYSLEVAPSASDKYVVIYPNEPVSSSQCSLWRKYEFTLDEPAELFIHIVGQAEAGWQNGTGDDDDLIVTIDGLILDSWNSDHSLDGNTQQGTVRTLTFSPMSHSVLGNLAAGTHTLRLYADETPTVYSLTISKDVY